MGILSRIIIKYLLAETALTELFPSSEASASGVFDSGHQWRPYLTNGPGVLC